MMNVRMLAIPSFIGIVMGVLSARAFFTIQWLNLVIWAIEGIIIGLFPSEKQQAVRAGISYGLFLTVSFLLSGFEGAMNELPRLLLLILGLSIIGIAGGVLYMFIGGQRICLTLKSFGVDKPPGAVPAGVSALFCIMKIKSPFRILRHPFIVAIPALRV